MKSNAIFVLFTIILVVFGCAPIEPEEPASAEPQAKADEPEQKIVEKITDNKPSPAEEKAMQVPEEAKEEEKVTKKIPEEVQAVFGNIKKVTSYSYFYSDNMNNLYTVKAKGSKIMMESPTKPQIIYIDTVAKTAEEFCIVKSRCGRFTGKTTDYKFSDVYIKTPIDWLGEITEAKILDELLYQSKKSLRLITNIGNVTIDKTYGFVYNIKGNNKKEYRFTDVAFNVVKDSEVVPPEWLT